MSRACPISGVVIHGSPPGWTRIAPRLSRSCFYSSSTVRRITHRVTTGRPKKRLQAHLAKLEDQGFANIGFLRDNYLRVAGNGAFDAALKLIIDGLEAERRG